MSLGAETMLPRDRRHAVVRGLLRWSLLAGVAYAALLGLLWWGQERLLFAPERLPSGYHFDLGPDVNETWVEVPGARLNALHLRLPQPEGVVLYLHGNAGNLASWFVDLDLYRRAHLDLFMLDYRGYGKSSGHIESEAQLHADVRAAWRQIEARYAGKRRVVIGRSLGSGLAATLAAEVKPDLTVLISPYESLAALAGEHYPWVPAALLRYPMRSDLALARVKTPLLLLHGDGDTLIGPWHSRRLLAAAPHAELLLVPGAGHNDLQRFPAYLDRLGAAMGGR